ncbi:MULTISPECIES: SCO2523 family variant P-loop protein [Streptomyces]|uniref:MinD/ParA family protein n=1 Tax=Streptomyces thermoviolaceus subsp. thermoviolaceus TaxID=66860 RepID=A0ABX0YMC7_STRTL|nr:SCO2523 family variant P-loop protein [Streptomyces thermoviolaceus]NJP13690.1 MinD/ParA family protein [Streptomyces thermoviolaceus subsp. thermoviolaceus]GHA98385.1 DNA-binding protein [Streptomyces thermoviolaceus subsp. thermoviolaceus]
MLVFAASDKGGTGRSVTSANLAYQRALAGDHVAYVDFDFGSPTAAAVFDVPAAMRGIEDRGLHSYLEGEVAEPARIDVWRQTEHQLLRTRPNQSGRLVLLPGDAGGGEFATGEDALQRCIDLLLRLHSEFDVIMVDLSAGRSYAVDMVLAATAHPRMRSVPFRWLVFHRWTRQHVIAAAGLVHKKHGIIAGGVERGHDEHALRAAIRFVRAAVPDPESPLWSNGTPAQAAWMQACDEALRRLAAEQGVGDSVVLGVVPLEPILQWREQLITEDDVLAKQIANKETLEALEEISLRLTDDSYWGRP